MELEMIKGRIAENLEALKQFTATPGNGCTRLPFTKEARDAVEYLKTIKIDKVTKYITINNTKIEILNICL